MHFSTALAAVAAVAPIVNAHGAGNGLPTIVGLNPKDLKTRDLLAGLGARFATINDFKKSAAKPANVRRDDRECGTGVGSCGAGLCCSQAGCKSNVTRANTCAC
jgi:hypothetical protein